MFSDETYRDCSSLQKTEDGGLGDWLLGTRPASSAPIGCHFSKNPQDWLMSRTEVKVRERGRHTDGSVCSDSGSFNLNPLTTDFTNFR